MNVLGGAFNVLASFHFDIAGALLKTQTLQGAVGGLQQKIDGINNSFMSLGIGFMSANTGLSGIVGTLGAAVGVSDKFLQSQLKLSGILGANREFLQGTGVGTHEAEMAFSEAMLENMGKQAMQFGISGKGLEEMTGLIAPLLIPEGSAGTNLDNAIQLSRGLMKSAQTFGFGIENVMSQFQRAIGGEASMGDTFFRRLVGDAPKAFEQLFPKGQHHGIQATLKAFNAANAATKVKVLNDAFMTFAGRTDIVNARVNSLSGQMVIFKNLLSPFEHLTNIFKPLGDVLNVGLVKVLKYVNEQLNTHGRRFVEIISKLIGDIVENPQKLMVNLLMLKDLQTNIKATAGILTTTGVFDGIVWWLSKAAGAALGVKFKIPFLGTLLSMTLVVAEALGRMFPFFKEMFAFVAGVGIVIGVMKFYGAAAATIFSFVLMKVLWPMVAVFTAMQVLSRAQAYAKQADLAVAPKLINQTLETVIVYKSIIKQALWNIFSGFDDISRWLSGFFRMSTPADPMVKFLAWFADRLSAVSAFISALNEGIASIMMGDWAQWYNPNRDTFGDIAKRMRDTYYKTFESHQEQMKEPYSGMVTNNTTNINQVNINNSFKQQMEPDRIAFSLKEQLLKAAANPTQAKKRSIGATGGWRADPHWGPGGFKG